MCPLLLAFMALMYACTTPQPTQKTGESSSIVQIDRETHFLTPQGEDVVVFPGAYLVKAEQEGLRLIAEEGTSSESVVIDASSQTHDQQLTGPTALTISEKEDEQVVVLLLPDGKGWEAAGSHGVISRAASRPRTSRSRLQKAIDLRHKIVIPTQPLSLSRISVRYATLNKTHQGSPNGNTWRLPVSDTVAAARFTFAWSGSPTPAQIPEINQIVQNKTCCLSLLIDNQPHSWPPSSSLPGRQPMLKTTFTAAFDKGGNLVTTVHLTNARSNTWPKTIRLAITSGKKQWQSAETKVYANAVSYYTAELHPIFSHDRCTVCHSLGDRPAIVAMHESRLGAGAYPDVEDAKTP